MHPDVDRLVNTLLQRYEEHADLLIDHARLRHDSIQDFTGCAEANSVIMRGWLSSAPLLEALQAGAAECGCSPLGRLSVQSCSASGSRIEGFTENIINHDGLHEISDTDIMIELGPVGWELDAPHEAGGSPSVPSLKLEASENPGFFRVLQIPRSDCRHGRPLPFSAKNVRQLIYGVLRVSYPKDDSMTVTGPAVTTYLDGEIDHVACLRVPWQQSREHFANTMPLNWLPAAAQEVIWRYGMHLVPTGCQGSVTEETEWRMSFSRAEVVVAWHLPADQKYAVIILKLAVKQLGEHGRTIKSYFIKSSLYWVCQQTPRHMWGGATQCARLILDYLQAAVAARWLSSFFCEDINLLRQATPGDLETMQQTIGVLQADFTPLLMRDLQQSEGHNGVFKLVVCRSSRGLSERQVRICAVRSLILKMVECEAVRHVVETLSGILPMLLRISTTREMLQMSSCTPHTPQCLKQNLLQAMSVAPDDVAGRARLTPCPGGGFTWDVAPLMELLTANDIRKMLVDAPAVFSWWRRQLTRPPSERPAGLSAELNTPRGLAQLVTNPSLLMRALDESVPGWYERSVFKHAKQYRIPPPQEVSFQNLKDMKTRLTLTEMTAVLHVRLHLSQPTAHSVARRWWTSHLRYWSDPDTETRFNTYSRDPWQLWQLFCHIHR